jgi:ribonuclease VapC
LTSLSPSADEKPNANSYVLDSSAILTELLREPGAELVSAALSQGAHVSTVNTAEVISRLLDIGFSIRDALDAVAELGLHHWPFDEEQAVTSGQLRASTRRFGLSLGDRACLALGRSLGRPVLTADRVWAGLEVGVEVVLCR